MSNYTVPSDFIKKYCELGYHIFPLVENSKIPHKDTKGVKDASNDPEKNDKYLSRFPNANWAIAAKNCFVIDVDNKGEKNGSADLAEMEKELGGLPNGPKVLTPTGGFHLYFAKPQADIVGRTTIAWKGRDTGIDLRIGNQYVVAPPSLINGKQYNFIEGLVPVDQLPELPADWIEFLPKRDASKTKVIATSISQNIVCSAPSYDGDQTKVIEKCRKYVAKMPPAISGQNGHNQTFYVACVIFCRFGLSAEEGFPIFLEYNKRCLPEWSEKELQHKMDDALAKASQSARNISFPVNQFDFPEVDDELDVKLKDWVPFPVELLPEPLPDFVRTTEASIGCDPVLIVVPLLSGLAAGIGNSRIIRLKNDNGDPWDEPSILWTISIAISGAKKTPGLNAIKKRFREYEKKAELDYEANLVRHKIAMSEFERSLKEQMKNQQTGKTDVGKLPVKPETPINNGIIVEDTTVEGLTLKLHGNQKGLLLVRDELSAWFRSFGRYSKGGDTDTPFYLEAYQGGSYSTTRKTSESYSVKRCTVSVTGTVQPRILGRFLRASDATDNGFIQRFLIAMPPSKRSYWNVRTSSSSKAVQDMQDIFDKLLFLPFKEYSDGEPEIMELASDARQLFISEHDRIEDEKANERSDFLRGFLSKHCAKIARLALIFQCVKEAAGNSAAPRLAIDADSMNRAIGVAQWFYTESVRCMTILGCARGDGVVEAEKSIVHAIIKANGPISKRNIGRSCSRVTNLAGALTSLLADGLIVQRENKPEGRGRPSIVFEVKAVDAIDENDTNALPSDT